KDKDFFLYDTKNNFGYWEANSNLTVLTFFSNNDLNAKEVAIKIGEKEKVTAQFLKRIYTFSLQLKWTAYTKTFIHQANHAEEHFKMFHFKYLDDYKKEIDKSPFKLEV
ncbi:hypothetical protein BpHYR1_023355, partial [Brachionus plicatilis]